MKTINYLKRIGFTVMFLFIGMSYVFSQEQSDKDWELLSTKDDVKVYVQSTECEGSPIYFFKFVNDSDIDQNAEVTIDIPSNPTFGPTTFKQNVKAKSNSGEMCKGSKLTLPRMATANEKASSKINVQLTLK